MSDSISSSPTRSVLGKGLASLLPGSASAQVGSSAPPPPQSVVSVSVNDRIPGISMLPIDQIKANEFQPRRDFDDEALKELSLSIQENGLIQPLVVRKNGNSFELIAGERRLRASKLAGLKMIPVVIRKSTDREALELAIVENIQREDLNCVDEGLAYFQLMQEFSLSQDDLAKKMGKDRATIANALRILKLSDSILAQLKKGALSRGHAKALLAVEDLHEREKLSKEILDKSLSVRQAERLSQEIKQGNVAQSQLKDKAGAKKSLDLNPPSAEVSRFKQELTRKFMTKVEMKGSDQQGQIILNYGSKEELYRILHQLLG